MFRKRLYRVTITYEGSHTHEAENVMISAWSAAAAERERAKQLRFSRAPIQRIEAEPIELAHA